MKNGKDNNKCSKHVSISERKFIKYLEKWFIGVRNEFIKKDIRRSMELSMVISDICYGESQDILIPDLYSEVCSDRWIDDIENKELYWYIKNLPAKQREIVNSVIIHSLPLTQAAKNLGISKQLAYAYKMQFIGHAKEILNKPAKRCQ